MLYINSACYDGLEFTNVFDRNQRFLNQTSKKNDEYYTPTSCFLSFNRANILNIECGSALFICLVIMARCVFHIAQERV
jgi:hypothetical protein